MPRKLWLPHGSSAAVTVLPDTGEDILVTCTVATADASNRHTASCRGRAHCSAHTLGELGNAVALAGTMSARRPWLHSSARPGDCT